MRMLPWTPYLTMLEPSSETTIASSSQARRPKPSSDASVLIDLRTP